MVYPGAWLLRLHLQMPCPLPPSIVCRLLAAVVAARNSSKAPPRSFPDGAKKSEVSQTLSALRPSNNMAKHKTGVSRSGMWTSSHRTAENNYCEGKSDTGIDENWVRCQSGLHETRIATSRLNQTFDLQHMEPLHWVNCKQGFKPNSIAKRIDAARKTQDTYTPVDSNANIQNA